jgi:DNA-binding transcriptional MocR family regulator
MRILVDRQSGAPLYQQVRDALHRLIAEGVLEPGAELPASRVLAKSLAVNRGTVTAAYDELVSAGLLRRHVGRGTFVVDAAAVHAALGAARSPRRVDGGLRWDSLFAFDEPLLKDRDPLAAEMARWAAKPGLLSFASGVPDPSLFPADAFRQALNRALRDEGASLLEYGTVAGYAPFVAFLRDYLLERGVGARPEEVLVVNGSQQGIDLVARTFVAPGDTIAVEDPSYHGALNLFRALRARLLPVPVDDEGLDVGAFERLLERERPKLLYTMPTFQNPTGVSLSLPRRRRLLAVAARHNVPILEDDFDGDLIYEGEHLPPLKGLPEGRDVLYTGTFSKMLFPGARLGWIVAPPVALERLAAAKRTADVSTSLLLQAAMVQLARGRTLARHAERVRGEYRRRRDALLLALEKEMPQGVTWTRPAGGFSLVVRLPPQVDALSLLPAAAARGVLYTAGRVFSLSGDTRMLRLSFGNLRSDAIAEGVRRLAAALKDELKARRTAAPRAEALAPPV